MRSVPAPINRTALKSIAAAAMAADHVCLILFPGNPAAGLIRLTVGRIAMPVFAFLLCEGFFHTRSRSRYALTLLVFALLSEPVFDFARTGTFWDPSEQNTLLTLLAGLLLLVILQELQIKNRQFFTLPVIAAFLLLAWFAHLDHDIAAIAMIVCFYFLHTRPVFVSGAAACSAAVLCYGQPGYYLALLPLLLYDPQRGKISAAGKYFFYLFYPAHLLAIAWIHILLSG